MEGWIWDDNELGEKLPATEFPFEAVIELSL
jgi:hypothetical protein